MSKKTGKQRSFPTNLFFNDDLDNSVKSENLSIYDESDKFSDISMEEDTQIRVFTLDDITEENFILKKLCGKKKKSPLFCKSSKQK